MSKKSIRSCADVGCSNSSGKLEIWKQTQCDMHKPLLHDQCPCLRPYSLHTFPGRAQDQGVRQEWIRNINREDSVPKINSTVGFGQQHVSYLVSQFLPCCWLACTGNFWVNLNCVSVLRHFSIENFLSIHPFICHLSLFLSHGLLLCPTTS